MSPVQFGEVSPARPAAKPVAARKPAAPTDPYAAILKLGLAPPDYSGLAARAARLATNSVGAQVAGIRAAQDQIRRDAAQNAGQVTQASIAAAKYLQSLNLGGAVAGDYADAAAAQRAAAAGYSGGLQQTVGDAAAQVQQNLAGLGSTQQAAPNQQAAGNVLYGLGGNLPAQQLDVQGPLQAAQIRGLPAQTLGYGQQQATGILGAGRQAAGQYDADIVKAQAQRATLTAQYLSDLEDKARQAGQNRIANTLSVLKLHQDEVAANARAAAANAPKVHFGPGGSVYSVDPKSGTVTTLREPTTAAAKPTYYQDAYGRQVMIGADGKQQVLSEGQWTDSAGVTYRVGLDGSQTAITGPRPFAPQTPPAPHYTTVSDATGTYVVNEDTGERRKVAGAPASATPSPSDTAGTAPPRLDPSRSALLHYLADQYGNPIGVKKGQMPIPQPGWKWSKGGRLVKTGGGGSSGSTLTAAQKNTRSGQLTQARQGASLAAFGGDTRSDTPITDRVLTSDPGDGERWSKPLTLPDGTIYGYRNYFPPVSLAEALVDASKATNPFAIAELRKAYGRLSKQQQKVAKGAKTARNAFAVPSFLTQAPLPAPRAVQSTALPAPAPLVPSRNGFNPVFGSPTPGLLGR